jgi:hypothetical protein
MGADFRLGADLLAIGIAIVGDRFLALERVLATAFALLFFFPAVDEVDLALEAGFFFLVDVPICMFMGIFDFEESRAVGCGC